MKKIRIIILIVLSLIILALIYWAILPEKSPEWTGFGTYENIQGKIRYKTLWDWLELIIIPISIGLFVWVFKEFEKEENKRAELEKSRDATLDSFMKIMSELLIQNDLACNPDQKKIAIVRTRINMCLAQLDGYRKGLILQFLYESNLIDIEPKLKLLGANFNNVVLNNIVLVNAEIRGAYFDNSYINSANLQGVVLNSCSFKNSDFTGSQMINADLGYTNLTNAKLKNMDLTKIDFEGANLTSADLSESIIKQDQLDNILQKDNIKLTNVEII